jgi:hypothetical protein
MGSGVWVGRYTILDTADPGTNSAGRYFFSHMVHMQSFGQKLCKFAGGISKLYRISSW